MKIHVLDIFLLKRIYLIVILNYLTILIQINNSIRFEIIKCEMNSIEEENKIFDGLMNVCEYHVDCIEFYLKNIKQYGKNMENFGSYMYHYYNYIQLNEQVKDMIYVRNNKALNEARNIIAQFSRENNIDTI